MIESIIFFVPLIGLAFMIIEEVISKREYPNGSILEHDLCKLDLNEKQLLDTSNLVAFDEKTMYSSSIFVVKADDRYDIKYYEELPDGRKSIESMHINPENCLLFEEDTDTPKVCKYSIELKGYSDKRIFYEIVVPKGTVSTL